MKIPIEDIEAVIKTLSSKLPKVDNGRDPNTYYAGREYGERSAYSDAIRLLMAVVKRNKALEVNSNPNGNDTWKELHDKYKSLEQSDPILKKYQRVIDEGNKQFFKLNPDR